MNSSKLMTGLFFKVSYGGSVEDKVYVTDATHEEFTKYYKMSKDFEEFKKELEDKGYTVEEFEPPYELRY